MEMNGRHRRVVTVRVFVRLVSMNEKTSFEFLRREVGNLIVVVSQFYNTFLRVLLGMPVPDRAFFKRVYQFRPSRIAALLPSLFQSIPDRSE
jgi:hypothetical protein